MKSKIYKYDKISRGIISKKIITICVILLMSANVFAQAPNKMSYQAIIRNSSNALITSSAVGMRISILRGSASGTAVYVETQTPTTNINGLASIEIGGGTIVSGTFATMDWSNGPYFIKTETDPTGGSNYSITGTSQLLSVPYALYAKNAGNVNSPGSFTHYIGEHYGGGVIFHLWKDNLGAEHGLVIATNDLSTSEKWSNITNASTGVQSTWNGLANTNAILGQSGHITSAAALCVNSSSGGYNDWYLPSVQEFNMLWINYYTVAKSLLQISGATQLSSVYLYWSSTQEGATNALPFAFSTGNGDNSFPKGFMGYVRAVRAY